MMRGRRGRVIVSEERPTIVGIRLQVTRSCMEVYYSSRTCNYEMQCPAPIVVKAQPEMKQLIVLAPGHDLSDY